MSSTTRQELLETLRSEYAAARAQDKSRFIDSLVAATGYNRKYATALLGPARAQHKRRRGRKATYDSAFREVLLQLWLAADKVCSKRLVPFISELVQSLERCDRLHVTPEQKEQLANVSAATVDRLLRQEKQKHGRTRRMPRPLSALKQSIDVRTCSDDIPTECGFFEADLVHHSGSDPSGRFACTLTAVDFASGWLELVAIPDRTEQSALRAFAEIQERLPFPLTGLDTDNGSEFINHALKSFCQSRALRFTRSRGYKKNDQAHVEQKNGAVVRKLTGYDRFETGAVPILNELYKSARLYINFFQPSVKLSAKQRDGAKISKQYETAATPFQRLLKSGCLAPAQRVRLERTYAMLDPIALLERIQLCRRKLKSLTIGKAKELVAQSISANPKRGRPAGVRGSTKLARYSSDLHQLLTRNPELGAPSIKRLLQTQHPEAKLPHVRQFQRFIHRWRAAHPELAARFPKSPTILIG